MLAGIIIGAALVLAALMCAKLGDGFWRSDRSFIAVSISAILIVAIVVIVVLRNEEGGFPAAGAASNGSLVTDEIARVSASLRDPAATIRQQTSVASVPSLIDGLEQRLRDQPDDPRGWALLAQSYAFVGQDDLAEQAVVRAVELGFDEADLRQRVASARRDPHAGLPGFASTE